MRQRRLFTALIFALVASGCAQSAAPTVAVSAPPSDIDALMYGTGAPPARNARGPAVTTPAVIAVPVAAPVIGVASRGSAYSDVEAPYTLDSGDKLRIVVFGQEGLTNSYVVDAGGNITMPLIASVPARGLTPQQLAGSINGRLRNGFVREPHVAVEVEAYRPFFILGEVTAPGQYSFVPKMTVETAVAIAGGFTPRAFRGDVRITRSNGNETVRFSAPLLAPVRPGDTITISERWF